MGHIPAILEPEDLLALLNTDAAVKILDATFVLPGSDLKPKENFVQERIGNAQFFDVDEIAEQATSLPHMLPSETDFERAVTGLGITNDDLVVVYAQHGMVMGPARAWWTFRVFGHNNVCVLNGGLPAWKAADLPLETMPPQPPKRTMFAASFKKDLVLDVDQMQSISEAQTRQVFDARAADRFLGQVPEPRAGLRSGHIPNSFNMPASILVDIQTGKLKPKNEIEALFVAAGFDSARPICTTCGSGVTACMLTLALYTIGYEDVAVYDGSWAEWGWEGLNTPVSVSHG